MGHSLSQASTAARDVFEAANRATGLPLAQVCFEGPSDRLTDTAFAQPGVVAVSLAAVAALEERLTALNAAVTGSFCAGHSVGEYAALAYSGALSLEDSLRLVAARGKAMAEASAVANGSMLAVMGIEEPALIDVCARASQETGAAVQVANLNAPGQIVISGNRVALERAGELARAAGAKRAIPLEVSGPFHSVYMQPAADLFKSEVERTPISTASIPVVLNVTARPAISSEELRSEMVVQVTSPVRWADSVRTMWDRGCTVFVECGPGTVLGGLIKRIEKEATVLNVEDEESLDKTTQKLAELMKE